MSEKSRAAKQGRRKRRWLTGVLAIGGIAAETVMMRRRGYRVGLDTVVRCRDGHMFTTIWIPGASLKAVRLGTVRLQYCPVGRHFTVVRPVKEAELAGPERPADLPHDVLIP
ncbi:MAG: hypothetical protein ACJ786_13845 [Catenulispora sp.]